MKSQKLKTTLVLALLLALALPTIAQPQRGFRGTGDQPQNIREELNLTDAQEKQMQNLRFDRESAMIDLRADLQTERLKLRKLRDADEPNKKKLYAQIDKIGAVEIRIGKARVDHLLAAQKILTKDQFKIFSKALQHQNGPREGRRGDMRDRSNKKSFRNRF